MITKDNLVALLKHLKFTEKNNIFKKEYQQGASISVNMTTKKITYAPVDSNFQNGEYPSINKPAKGFVIHRETTLDFKATENFVCLVCVHLLLKKGYEPKHIVFEPAFKVGHINKPSYGDILVLDKEYKPLVLIENKTFGSEFSREWNNMQKNGGQLFSYLGPLVNQLGFCENLVLFAADFEDRIIPKSHIITLKDNEKRIKELENPKTFKDAHGQYFDVWSDTYVKSFETKGLFEDDIAAYSIGKLKYTIKDLKSLSHAEIRPIYNEFATILRNHAITDFEHSFYILIDLFLCKITDELNNPNDLQFYYKGITRDTPKEYCTRLLTLYQLGKKQLFNIDVVNKEESDIRQVFEDTDRILTNGLYAGIKALFEEIKFYNIKKFNFIDVENREDFELNFQILIKIAALIQDINLSNSETNHFFGDLFEGLLSKNVHQTEGQFFTPLPIVNFIIKSLPQFPDTDKVKVLDYACGAGHFLTEFVKLYPKVSAFGIEKSQPLSQVAKIASIINGAKESHIVFKDSLSELDTREVRFQGFEEDTFDCIIANPPYSVKGFLNTLTDCDRKKYDLVRFVKEKAFESNNSIECFFIERAKHFLKKYGLMGIVLPSSILSNGNLYKNVRELLFANFNILAIVYLGGRTFGSTGTNTIILFAQRAKKNSEGLLNTFIEKGDYTQYMSHEAIDDYFQKQGYDKDDFFAFMQDETLNETLENHEIFVDYRKVFTPKPIIKTTQIEWYTTSSFFNPDLKKTSIEYKNLFEKYIQSDEYKKRESNEFRKQFTSYAKEIERDKLNTFIQIANNTVLILQSPPDIVGSKSNKAQVIKFLGYDWSKRKGDEGIKYITSHMEDELEDSGDDKDSEVLNAINSIRFIDTPLYNPNDEYDNTKFAFAIRKHITIQCKKYSFTNFTTNNPILKAEYSGEMDNMLSCISLADMMDFSKAHFDKEIKTRVKTEMGGIEYESKFPLESIENLCRIIRGVTFDKALQTTERTKNIVLTADNITIDGHFVIEKEIYVSETVEFDKEKKLQKNDIFMCFSSGSRNHVGKVALIKENTNYYAGGFMCLLRAKETCNPMFLFEVLNSDMMRNIVRSSANGTNILNLSNSFNKTKIPLPPPDIQKCIVSECGKVDAEYTNAKKQIDNCKSKIEAIMNNIQGDEKNLGDVCNINTEKCNPTETPQKEFIYIDIESVENGEGTFKTDKKIYGVNAPTRARRYAKSESTIISTVRPNLKGFAFVEKEIKDAVYSTGFAILKSKNTKELLDKMIYFYFMYSYALMQQMIEKMPKGQYPSINKEDIANFKIPIPSIEEQIRIVVEITTLEKKISEAKAIIEVCPKRKKQILDKWLK